MSPFTIHKKIDTSRLHGSDLRTLASILQGIPGPGNAALDAYHATISKEIKSLSRRMRQSVLGSKSTLCMTHKGLDHYLISDVWDWVQFEFDAGIGKYVFPLILSRKLSAVQERKIRQLEPVLQMWRREFRLETSAPPGRLPIETGTKWKFQGDQCKACMLARVGSDEGVVFALLAGMITRFPSWKLASGHPNPATLTVAKLAHPKSNRIRFVRYWLRGFDKHDVLVNEAVEFGLSMKKAYREWKEGRRAGRPSIYGGRYSLDGLTLHSSNGSNNDPFDDRHCVPAEAPRPSTSTRPSRASRGQSTLHPPSTRAHTSHQASTHRAQPDPKLGPQPRPNIFHPHTPLEDIGFTRPRTSPPISDVFSDIASTIYPDDSISNAPTPHQPHQPHQPSPSWQNPVFENLDVPPSRVASLNVPHVPSRTSPPSSRTAKAYSSAATSPTLTSATSLVSGATITSYDGGRVLIPSCQSMYFGYGDEKEADPFEGADEYVVEEEVQTPKLGEFRTRRDSRAGTEWSKFY